MLWSDICREIDFTGESEAFVLSTLKQFHTDFLALCQRKWMNKPESSPFEALVQYIFKKNISCEAAITHLQSLLQQPEDKHTRYMEAAEMELRARFSIARKLSKRENDRWNRIVPPSLLDIDIEYSPFVEAIRLRVNELRRPDGFFCTTPFEYVHIQANGDVYPCCPSKFGKVIGNLTKTKLEDVWNSDAAREVRDSMLDGSYRFCNAEACEYLRGAREKKQTLSPPTLVEWVKEVGLIDKTTTPKVANFGFDRTCNLSCEYCRTELFRPKQADLIRIKDIDGNIFDSYLDKLERIILLGEGDPFASPFYREKLQRYHWSQHPNLKIKIQSNGLLLTPKMWKSIERSHCAIDWISISVDAATADTYKLNRKGDFNLLLQNLEFISHLRATNTIDQFFINFLVLDNNFHEIPAFAELGLRLGCDLIEFQRLENWGTYSEKEYMNKAVHEPFHPKHREFLQVLNEPVLLNKGVWLLKLGADLPGTQAVNVHTL